MKRRLILTPVQLRVLAASPVDGSQDCYVSTMIGIPQRRVGELRDRYLKGTDASQRRMLEGGRDGRA